MTRREHERIEREVQRALRKNDYPDGTLAVWLMGPEVVALIGAELAKERARVRGIIMACRRTHGADIYGHSSGIGFGVRLACNSIFAALKGK